MRPSPAPPDSGLGTPLSEVDFVVIDLETTGTTPGESRVIEVGAAKYRGGECLGTFQTLVDPGCPVPPVVVALTGITEALVATAPPLEQVLPSLLEFVGDSVLVGHNLRFDTSFLDTALAAAGRPQLGQARVDTLALARRLLDGKVPDRRLSTLAGFFQTATAPTHRALDDARATGEVLHGLLERSAGFGVLTLGDLLSYASAPWLDRRRLARRAFAWLRRLACAPFRRVRRAPRSRRPGRCPWP